MRNVHIFLSNTSFGRFETLLHVVVKYTDSKEHLLSILNYIAGYIAVYLANNQREKIFFE